MCCRSPRTSLLLPCALLAFAVLAQAASAEDEREPLKGRYGYLVVDSDVAAKVLGWKLSDLIVIDTLPLGRHLQLLKLKAGKYHWQELQVPYFNLPNELDVSDDERWFFTIERGKLNYAGTLIVGELRQARNVDVRFLNRSAEVLDLVRTRFPTEMERYGLIYSGSNADDFLAFFEGSEAVQSAN
jgi:hypothetical protein